MKSRVPAATQRTPPASSVTIKRRMENTRQQDTSPEVQLRKALHRLGLRYFVHRRPIAGLRTKADIVFPRARLAIFIDGCFWHGCPEHGTWPKSNAEWWREKIERNRRRDAEATRLLSQAGWTVLRIWEHEPVQRAVEKVRRAWRRNTSRN